MLTKSEKESLRQEAVEWIQKHGADVGSRCDFLAKLEQKCELGTNEGVGIWQAAKNLIRRGDEADKKNS